MNFINRIYINFIIEKQLVFNATFNNISVISSRLQNNVKFRKHVMITMQRKGMQCRACHV